MKFSYYTSWKLYVLILGCTISSNTASAAAGAGATATAAFLVNSLAATKSSTHTSKYAVGAGTGAVTGAGAGASTDDSSWRRPDLFGTSLIDQTVQEMSTNVEFQETTQKLQILGSKGMTKEERAKRRRALDSLGVPSFNQFLYMYNHQNADADADAVDNNTSTTSADKIILQRKKPQILQLNIGLYCNQACTHCHVESSPLRQESMSPQTAAKCIQLLENTPSIHTLDITGGAPELNDNFRYIVTMARHIAKSQRRKLDIIDRCNLTVLQEPGQGQDLINFLVENDVHIVASLPCYSEDNVDKQRGNGVFDRSISALLALNDAGYGHQPHNNANKAKHLKLDLVYNPSGAFLPPREKDLEIKYKQVLYDNFGIVFNSLYTMTNMPIKRFADYLYKRNELKEYMNLLVTNFNQDTLENVMCRNTISVGYDGYIYDCDFNQQLGYTIGSSTITSSSSTSSGGTNGGNGGGKSVFDIESLDELGCISIKNDSHCFGCTAGMGSS